MSSSLITLSSQIPLLIFPRNNIASHPPLIHSHSHSQSQSQYQSPSQSHSLSHLYPSDLSSNSARSTPLNHIHHSQAHSHLPTLTRKSAVQVFGASIASDPMPHSSHPHISSSALSPLLTRPKLQTVVNNKENQVPEVDPSVPPFADQSSRLSNQTRALGIKGPSQSHLNCVAPCQGDIVLASPSPELTKPRRATRQAPRPQLRSPVRSACRHESTSSKSHPPTPTPSSVFISRLDSALFRSGVEIEASQRPDAGQTANLELNSLVAKLEALGTRDLARDEGLEELMEPLPEDAICPGAPKLPSTLAMPLFECGNEDEGQELTVGSKSPSIHRMSPLAEVTEAYTGLQGGWSPPTETLSIVLSDEAMVAVPLSNSQQPEVVMRKNKTRISSGWEVKLDKTKPRYKRRREHFPSNDLSDDHLPRAPAKGPLRI